MASMRWPGSSSLISGGIGQRRSGRRRITPVTRRPIQVRRDAAAGGFDFGQFGQGVISRFTALGGAVPAGVG